MLRFRFNCFLEENGFRENSTSKIASHQAGKDKQLRNAMELFQKIEMYQLVFHKVLFFVIFINDISQYVDIGTANLFADDT